MLIQARKHMTARLPSSTSCQPLLNNLDFVALAPDGGWVWRVWIVFFFFFDCLFLQPGGLCQVSGFAFFSHVCVRSPVDPGLKQPRLHFRRIPPGIIHDRLSTRTGEAILVQKGPCLLMFPGEGDSMAARMNAESTHVLTRSSPRLLE